MINMMDGRNEIKEDNIKLSLDYPVFLIMSIMLISVCSFPSF
jgi:hypothetical protein